MMTITAWSGRGGNDYAIDIWEAGKNNRITSSRRQRVSMDTHNSLCSELCSRCCSLLSVPSNDGDARVHARPCARRVQRHEQRHFKSISRFVKNNTKTSVCCRLLCVWVGLKLNCPYSDDPPGCVFFLIELYMELYDARFECALYI